VFETGAGRASVLRSRYDAPPRLSPPGRAARIGKKLFAALYFPLVARGRI
jgi:hypothetical protein